MERRDRSLKALKELTYIDSLDSFEKADAIGRWFDTYLKDDSIENFDLELLDLKRLEELFFKSINFLKNHREETRQEIIKMQKMKRFLKN
jgi:hypothetical protein